MPTVQGLIDEVNRIAPNNGYSNTVLVEWFNKLQRKYYKYMTSLAKHEFTTVANQETYTLPSNCKIDGIIYLGLCTDTVLTATSVFTPYNYKGINETKTDGSYYDALDGKISLYKIPDKSGYNVKIIYNKRPAALTTSSLSYTPDLNEDYHDIYVFDACQRIFSSGNAPNATLANYYDEKVKEIHNEIMKDYMEDKVRARTKDPANNWWKVSPSSSSSIIP